MSETGPGPMSNEAKLGRLEKEEAETLEARSLEELADKYDSVPNQKGSQQYEAGDGSRRPLSEIREDIAERRAIIEAEEARRVDDVRDKTIPEGDTVEPDDYEHLNPAS
ncbi:MAG TPA: hypothetical protein VLF21_00230 [Candidatus Saccharimonadales bacterium]|nr:hypothetical protein [Candidatus Saccharimonadales bacterium]